MIKIFDTLAGEKKELRRPLLRKIRIFVCGPTVYNYIHLGNARTFANFDTIVRYLRHRGYRVKYLQNITDVDDKIIARAKEENRSSDAVARDYEAAFHEDAVALNITAVDTFARATDFIPEIERQVEKLLRRGAAYRTEDGYYFDLTKFADYGKLARRTKAQAEDGVSRIDESVTKKNRGDFAIWKFSKPGEPAWKSKTLGDGRPGWHIEDTAITERFFGPQYEIHGGARDLIFPHHEAEIAIEETISGKKPLVNIWMHAGFLETGNTKMSKSLGNFVNARELLNNYSGNVIRLMFAKHHYRAPMNWTDAMPEEAKKTLWNFEEFQTKLRFLASTGGAKGNEPLSFEQTRAAFKAAMDDDFNTPAALAALFEFLTLANKNIWRIRPSDASRAAEMLDRHLRIFGVELSPVKIPPEAAKLVEERERERRNQQFTNADALRRRVEALGYIVEDTPYGPLVLPK